MSNSRREDTFNPIKIQRILINEKRLIDNKELLEYLNVKKAIEIKKFDREELLTLLEKYNKEHNQKVDFIYIKLNYSHWDAGNITFVQEKQGERSAFIGTRERDWESNEIGYYYEWKSQAKEPNETTCDLCSTFTYAECIEYNIRDFGIIIESLDLGQNACYNMPYKAFVYYNALDVLQKRGVEDILATDIQEEMVNKGIFCYKEEYKWGNKE